MLFFGMWRCFTSHPQGFFTFKTTKSFFTFKTTNRKSQVFNPLWGLHPWRWSWELLSCKLSHDSSLSETHTQTSTSSLMPTTNDTNSGRSWPSTTGQRLPGPGWLRIWTVIFKVHTCTGNIVHWCCKHYKTSSKILFVWVVLYSGNNPSDSISQ